MSAFSAGHNDNVGIWERPDTVFATLEFPNHVTCAYLGAGHLVRWNNTTGRVEA
jgi:hypothetical protein